MALNGNFKRMEPERVAIKITERHLSGIRKIGISEEDVGRREVLIKKVVKVKRNRLEPKRSFQKNNDKG